MSVRITAYSSSANLGSGFDILSLAHNAFKDEVIIEENKDEKIEIQSNNGIPLEVEKNSAGLAAKILLQEKGIDKGVKIKINKGIPFGLGLGSSGASAAATVYGINELFDLKLDKNEMVKYAMLGEQASSGSPHPDNVAASIFGGIVSVSSISPIKVVEIPVNLKFNILLIVPEGQKEGKTKKAREILPKQIELSKYVNNARYLSSFILGIIKGDRELTGIGLNDEIVEVAREPLFPYYKKIKEISLKNNAIGSCVSGAGPSILVLYDEETNLDRIKKEANDICISFNIKCNFIHAKLAEGARNEGLN
ncbi:homoserine kinase [Acidianus sulfidivorans JP7]|uniref:Homoserine kinase n=1 Tax=Acidianus sulfidivorans JP7 TaxID=619593 RepID=A0A2U9IKY3_9CREN|nr:homoserine kinase [Acidianus sulfidivorans]AWR96670.1 homoserine kinase [Acidianus sulfidivorans JP7]